MPKWIWIDEHEQTPNLILQFRHTFLVPNQPFNLLVIRIACRCRMRLYINGKLLLRSFNPSHPEYAYYEEITVEAPLDPEVTHLIAVEVLNYGKGMQCRPAVAGGLWCEIQLGDTIIAESGKDWLVRPCPCRQQDTPRMFHTLGFQEFYDADLDDYQWRDNPYDDSGWLRAQISPLQVPVHPRQAPPPCCAPTRTGAPRFINAAQVPQHRWTTETPAKEIAFHTEHSKISGKHDLATIIANEAHLPLPSSQVCPQWKEGYPHNIEIVVKKGYDTAIVFDTGRVHVGYLQIQLTSDGEGLVDIGYAEELDSRGRVTPTRQYIGQADRIKGKYWIEWESFDRRSFRYLQLTFRQWTDNVTIKAIHVIDQSYGGVIRGQFQCSDGLLNQIWQTSERTLMVAMQDVHEDCPLREMAQYSLDLYLQSGANIYLTGDPRLTWKGLREIAETQREDGLFLGLGPTFRGYDTHNMPNFCMWWVLALEHLYRWTGNRVCLVQNWQALTTVLEHLHLLIHNSPHGLMDFRQGWVFVDWDGQPHEGVSAALAITYFATLEAAEKLAEWLGEHHLQATYQERKLAIQDAVNTMLWVDGAYRDRLLAPNAQDDVRRQSTQVQILALWSGIAPAERIRQLWEWLNEHDPLFDQIATPMMHLFTAHALAQSDQWTRCAALIKRYWGAMLNQGATVWWEMFRPNGTLGAFAGAEAKAHGWGVAPLWLLGEYMLGITPLTPGCRKIRVAPQSMGLDFCQGIVPIPGGNCVQMSWTYQDEMLDIKLGLPPNITAEVINPSQTTSCFVNGTLIDPGQSTLLRY